MRYLSAIILVCFVFLSSFAAIMKPAQSKKMDCCKKMAKMACHKKPVNSESKTSNCSQPGCAMMFSCSFCGFIPVRNLSLQPPQARILPKPVAHYIPGNTASYDPDNWKPPKLVN